MNIQTNNILDIAITEVNSINEKIKGINFLEILKINLIEKNLDQKVLLISAATGYQLDQLTNLCLEYLQDE